MSLNTGLFFAGLNYVLKRPGARGRDIRAKAVNKIVATSKAHSINRRSGPAPWFEARLDWVLAVEVAVGLATWVAGKVTAGPLRPLWLPLPALPVEAASVPIGSSVAVGSAVTTATGVGATVGANAPDRSRAKAKIKKAAAIAAANCEKR